MHFLRARTDAVLPLSKPIIGRDGTEIDSIYVPKDTLIFVAVQASNVNPDLWGADAREWRPERWLEPLPEAITEAKIPGIYSNLCAVTMILSDPEALTTYHPLVG